VKKELNDYLSPLETDKPVKKKLTKFDILMLNPKSLPRKKMQSEKDQERKRVADMQQQEEHGDEERPPNGRFGFTQLKAKKSTTIRLLMTFSRQRTD
jgi:hypothetical protein